MNAHAPVATGSATGRPALDTQVLAVQQAAVLRYVADHPGSEPGEIAHALGRDASNVKKTVERLGREGLVTARPYSLTDEGRSWIPRLAALDGAPAAEALPTLSWLRIRRDPNNPRKIDADDPTTAAELAALAENIGRRGLLVPVRVRLDEDGLGGMLNDGERRHRAIEILIRNADPRWPAAKALPYTTASPMADAGEAMADALITSIHKKDLNALEEAEAFAWLKAQGWEPRRIWEETGFDERVYQQRLDLLNLTDAQKARMRLPKEHDDYLSVKGARGLLQHLRQIANPPAGAQLDLEARTLDLPPKLQLALLEVAFAVEQRSDRGRVPLSGAPAGGALATLAERGVVTVEQVGGSHSVGIPKAGAAMAWLNDFHFFDNPTSRLAAVRAEVLGATKHNLLATTKVYATDELNTDPAVYNGVRFPNAMRANEARRHAEGDTGGAGSPSRPKPAQEPDVAPLKPRHLLILTELAHKVMNDPVRPAPFGYGVTRVGSHWLDGNVEVLVQEHRLIAFTNLATADGWLGYLTDAGWEVLLGKGGIGSVPAEVLKAAQEAVVGRWDAPEYVTRWLNVEAKAAPAPDVRAPEDVLLPGASAAGFAPAEEEDDVAEQQDLDEAAAAEVLAKVIAGLASGDALRGRRENAHAFSALLELTGIKGPFETTDVHPGVVFAADPTDPAGEVDAATADVNGELPNAIAEARARLIAFALTHCAAG